MPELCRHRLGWGLPESCGEEGDCGHRGETHGHCWAPGYALAAGTTHTRSNSVTQVFYATSASPPGQETSLLDQYRAGIPVAVARGHLRHWEGLAAAACKRRAPHCTPEPSQHPQDPLAGWSALTAALASSFKGSRMKKGGKKNDATGSSPPAQCSPVWKHTEVCHASAAWVLRPGVSGNRFPAVLTAGEAPARGEKPVWYVGRAVPR